MRQQKIPRPPCRTNFSFPRGTSIPKPHAHGPVAGRIEALSRYQGSVMASNSIVNTYVNNCRHVLHFRNPQNILAL
jgi:hypothetical protein